MSGTTTSTNNIQSAATYQLIRKAKARPSDLAFSSIHIPSVETVASLETPIIPATSDMPRSRLHGNRTLSAISKDPGAALQIKQN